MDFAVEQRARYEGLARTNAAYRLLPVNFVPNSRR
jgi:hypothetical protein